MLGKIGLEEHLAIAETLADSAVFLPDRCWGELSGRLLDVQKERIAVMDAHGMEMMILSLNAPTVQGLADPKRAATVARAANDALAGEVARRPDRFAALAALPMQDPEAAARELERCVMEVAFCGALINGFSQRDDPNAALYYDTPDYWPFWETVERLDVPFYLHPRNPLPAWAQIYGGHSWLLGPTWAFGVEAATHALRLMGSGLFDRFRVAPDRGTFRWPRTALGLKLEAGFVHAQKGRCFGVGFSHLSFEEAPPRRSDAARCRSGGMVRDIAGAGSRLGLPDYRPGSG